MMTEEHARHEPISPAAYLVTWGILMVLLGLTILVAHWNLGAMSTFTSLLIAAVKAFIVALIFMHIRVSSRVTWIFAGAGLLWLVLMFTMTVADYATR